MVKCHEKAKNPLSGKKYVIIIIVFNRWIAIDVDVAMGRFAVLELSVMILRS